MADAVHFLTREDTGTPADSSGCNGFPFPTNDGTAYPEGYPIVTTIQDVAKWFYRVKKWTFTTDFSFTAAGGPYTLTQGIAGPTALNFTELDTIKFYRRLYSWNGGSDVTTLDFFFNDPLLCLKLVTGAFSPGLTINSGVAGGGTDGVSLSTLASSIPAPTGTINATVDGYTVPLFYIASGGTVTCTQFDFTPSEFWPYAAADSSPIYNTTTGAQLQDPRN